MRHKHADVIHAWAEGIPCQVLVGKKWMNMDDEQFFFDSTIRCRIKPTPTTDEQTDDHTGICLEVEA